MAESVRQTRLGRDDGNMERTRGTMVRTLVFPADVQPAYGYAMTFGADGEVYVVCTEGVGWKVTKDKPLIVDAWRGMTAVEFEMSMSEVLRSAYAGTDVDLADHVRKFGDRLETNFRLWHRRINGDA